MLKNPNISFLIDIYDDKDRNNLSYLMIQSKARIANIINNFDIIKNLISCYLINIFNIRT